MPAYGSASMTGRLERVLVRPPLPEDAENWRAYGWRAAPDVAAAVAEHEDFRALLESAGAEVVVSTHDPGNPDAMYVYDPVLVGAEGAVLLRPGKEGRRTEPGAIAASLADAGVPVAHALAEPVVAEGGDTVWLDELTLLVGIGYRTSPAAVPALAAAFPGVEVVAFDLPHWNGRAEVMHLMSLISPLDRDLASSTRGSPRSVCSSSSSSADRGHRGARRRVRDPGSERARAGAETGARARREPGDAPTYGDARASTSWSTGETKESRRRATAAQPASPDRSCGYDRRQLDESDGSPKRRAAAADDLVVWHVA